jgi:hypothetical protein
MDSRGAVRVGVVALLVGCAGDGPAADGAPGAGATGPDTPSDEGPDTGSGSDSAPAPACAAPPPPPSSGSAEPIRFETSRLDPSVLPTGCLGADDLDGDGWVDVWWGDAESQGLAVSWGRADGGFDTERVPVPVEPSVCLMLPDEDGGSTLWLASPSELGGVRPGPGRAWTALPARAWPGLGDVFALAAADLDGDRIADLLAARSGEGNICVSPEPGAGGDLLLPSEQRRAGEVLCLRGGAGGFLDAPSPCPAALSGLDATYLFAISLQDLNDDAAPEILVTGDFGTSRFAQSGPEGWSNVSATVGVGTYGHVMGAAWPDLDGDGLRDVYLTDYGADQALINRGCPLFFDSSSALSVASHTRNTITWGVAAADFDRDGDADLFLGQSYEPEDARSTLSICQLAAEGEPMPGPFLLRNGGDGVMEGRLDVFEPDLPGLGTPVAVLPLDLDADGDLDVVTTQRDRGLWVHRNVGAYAGSWVAVRPHRADGQPAWGARVTVRQGRHARVQELWPEGHTSGQAPPIAHFGLGASQEGEVVVEVRWPLAPGDAAPAVTVHALPVRATSVVTR